MAGSFKGINHASPTTAGGTEVDLGSVERVLFELVKAVREVEPQVNVAPAATPAVHVAAPVLRLEPKLEVPGLVEAVAAIRPTVNLEMPCAAPPTVHVAPAQVTVQVRTPTAALWVVSALVAVDIGVRLMGLVP